MLDQIAFIPSVIGPIDLRDSDRAFRPTSRLLRCPRGHAGRIHAVAELAGHIVAIRGQKVGRAALEQFAQMRCMSLDGSVAQPFFGIDLREVPLRRVTVLDA